MTQSRFRAVRLLHARDEIAAADTAPRPKTTALSSASRDVVSTTHAQIERDMRPTSSLTHAWIWSAVDLLAERHGLSASGLARRAGLDPTTFNPSKRTTPDGNPRWPSTASLSKVLAATATTLDAFASLHAFAPTETSKSDEPIDHAADPRSAPVLADIRDAEIQDWPHEGDRGFGEQFASSSPSPFGLTVADDSLEPVYSRGHTLIVSIGAAIRTGDRIVLKQLDCRPFARLLLGETTHQVVVATLTADQQIDCLNRGTIAWMGRVVWVRQ